MLQRPGPRPFATAVLIGLLLGLGIRGAGAGEPAFTVRSWMTSDGLPTSTVHDIVETPDGYLWVATTGGLSRFDGVRFHTYGSADGLPSSRFSGLMVARDGTLWAATEEGWLCHWDGVRFWTSDTRQRLSEATMFEAEDSSLVGASAARLWRFRAGRMDVITDAIDDRHSRFVLDARGGMWITAPGGAPGRMVGDRVVRIGHGATGDEPTGRWIRDERGGDIVFYRTIGHDAELLDPTMRRVALLPGAGEEWPHLIDRQGRLWTTTHHDVVARDAASGLERQRYRIGLTERPFRVRPDRDGNLWVCTQTQGLIRIAPSPLRLLRPAGHTAAIEILHLNGTSDGGVLAIDFGGHAWRPGDDALLPSAIGSYGRGPAAPWLGVGETRYRTTGEGLEVRDAGGHGGLVRLPGVFAQTLAVDPGRPGTLYVLFTDRVHRIDAAASPPRVDVVFIPPNEVRDLYVDRQHRLWIATMVGLWRIAPGETLRYTRSAGLPVDHVRQIHEDEDGTMWFGTYGGGLVRWRNGRFAALDHRHGLIEDVVSVVLEDDADYLWLAGNHGIQRLSRRQANDCLDGRRARVDVVGYGREAGLSNPEGSGQKGLRTPDGRLWFPTFDGLAVVDPVVAHTLTGSPPIPRIEAVAIEEHESPRTGRDVTIPAGTPRFEVHYTGFDLRAAEQLRFRYRLEGIDRDWVDAGTARTATYTTVPPGRHRFRLEVVSGAGTPSVREDAMTIQVLPRFWQTPWFVVLAVLGTLGALAAGQQWRDGRLLGRADELQQAVETRTAELAREKGRTEDALATVEEQAHRLTALDRARSRFFASISHEFRTPLTLIHGPLHDIRAGEHGPVHTEVREQIDIALDSSLHLQRLVDQLLDAARAEAGELRVVPRPGDLVAFLARLADALAPLADRKRIAFTSQLPLEPTPVAFDAEAMEKVFANLLGNAFKFTPAGGHVTLAASVVCGADAPVVEVAVTDDGPGIAAEDLPHVFKRFYRAEHSITRVQPGTGLGLALAADVIEQHGGSIRAESHEGCGSTFTVRLALLAQDAPAVAPVAPDLDCCALATFTDEIRVEPNGIAEPEPVVPSSSDADTLPIVLIVDDHAAVRDYLARHLRRHYRVVEAVDGRQALAAMRREVPDLVVSDVTMPELDGHGLVRAIREDPELDFVPVLLLTAAASPDSRIAGLEGGADDYLTKPFSMRELLARVGRALESRRRLRERVARAAAAAAVYGGSPTPPDVPETVVAKPPTVAGPAAGDPAFVHRLREVIESRMGDEDFDVERLAEAMGMGRSLLFRRVAELLDQTPRVLIMNYRLERAAQLLRDDDGGVGEVAYAVGFRTVSHFTRRFHDHYGVTPSVWKRGDAADPAVSISTPSTVDA